MNRPVTRQRVAVALMALLAGCVGREPSRFEGLTPAQARTVARDLAADRDRDLAADLATARPPANALVLSGGEAHGALGCGVLAGWQHRPEFDVVTGVSTGALMATFAFLGTAADDAELRDVYLHARDADVFAGPVGGPPDAALDTAPLRALIARHVTANVLRRVAAAHAAGRRLYAATVEVDTGALVIWPMSRLAADAVTPAGVDPAGLDRFRAILLAAASIPVLFPPVEIDRGLHVDAGLRQAVVLTDAMLGSTSASPTVWLIFNGPLGVAPQPVDADVADLGGRSLVVFAHALETLSVRQAAGIAGSHRPPCRFRWVSQPPDADGASAVAPGLLSPMFDPRQTAAWYGVGQRIGQLDDWHDGPPTAADVGG